MHQNFRLVVVDTTKVDIFKQITTFLRYHKVPQSVVVDTTKVDIFKQITTAWRYGRSVLWVVVDTTKVDIFKQITTNSLHTPIGKKLLLIPQR